MNTYLLPLAVGTVLVCPAFADKAAQAPDKREDLMVLYLNLFTQNKNLLEGVTSQDQLDKALPDITALLEKIKSTDTLLEKAPIGSVEKMDKAWNEMIRLLREQRPSILALNNRLSQVKYYDSEKLMDASVQLVKDVDMIRIQDLMKEVTPLVMSYYKNPQPDKIADLMKKEAELIDLTREIHDLPGKVGFFMEIFKNNPKKLAEWINEVHALPPLARQTFLTALYMADTPETKAEVTKYVESDPVALHMAKNMDKDLSTPKKLDKASNPSALDLAWGAFFASGDPEYVHSIIRCAVRPDEEGKTDMTKEAARWSVKAIGKSDPRVKEIADAYLKTRTDEEQKVFQMENRKKGK